MTRVVVVTGAASGIGLGIAKAFLEGGDIVHLADISLERLKDATSSWSEDSFHLHQTDVSDFGQVQDLVARSTEGADLDVFVNNAGVFDGYCDILDTSVELWQRVIDINLTGTFYGCKVAAEKMIAQKSGRIINIGSVAASRASADGLSYGASKTGVVGLTKRLAVDLGPHGVTANIVAPGTIGTDIRKNSGEILGGLVDMDRGVSASLSQEMKDWLIPAHRPGSVEEIASLVLYLASEDAAYLTGQLINMDGGWTAT